jgi:hypothetical protein
MMVPHLPHFSYMLWMTKSSSKPHTRRCTTPTSHWHIFRFGSKRFVSSIWIMFVRFGQMFGDCDQHRSTHAFDKVCVCAFSSQRSYLGSRFVKNISGYNPHMRTYPHVRAHPPRIGGPRRGQGITPIFGNICFLNLAACKEEVGIFCGDWVCGFYIHSIFWWSSLYVPSMSSPHFIIIAWVHIFISSWIPSGFNNWVF